MIRFEDLIDKVRKTTPDADTELLRRAYVFSAYEHRGQVRRSGEPYLVHPLEVADLLVGWMGPFHEGREWLQRDEAQRSIGMAMQTLMLTAKAMGYDSCPMIGFDIDEVAKLIKLPEDHVMGPMVAIGKGAKGAWPKPGQLGLDELVVENSF